MFKVSVVVPFYNASRYIEKCVISLMEQKLDAVEYIFIDDGSTDNSLTILNHVLSLYPSRKVATRIVSRCNKGVTFSRNEGMQLATGRYLIFIDSDDWVESNFLDLMYEKATMYSSDIIICDYISHNVSGVNYISQKFEPNENCQLIKSIFNDDVQGFLWNKLIKTDLYKDVNGFDLDINYMEDILCLIKLIFKSKVITYLPEGLVHYNRLNENSITSNISDQKIIDIQRSMEKIEEFSILNGIYDEIEIELNLMKLRQKIWIIHCYKGRANIVIKSLFIDANRYIKYIKNKPYFKLLSFLVSIRWYIMIEFVVLAKLYVSDLKVSFRKS